MRAEFFLHQNLARAMGQDFHHNSSLFLYIPLFALGFFPWSIFFIKAWAAHVRIRPDGDDRTGQAALFAAVWTVSIIAVFSLAKSKLPGYILPAFPGAALLVGLMWSKTVEAGKAAVLRPYAIASLAVASVFAVLLHDRPQAAAGPDTRTAERLDTHGRVHAPGNLGCSDIDLYEPGNRGLRGSVRGYGWVPGVSGGSGAADSIAQAVGPRGADGGDSAAGSPGWTRTVLSYRL